MSSPLAEVLVVPRRGIRERKVASTPNRTLTSDVQSNTAHAQATMRLCCSSGADDTSHWRVIPVQHARHARKVNTAVPELDGKPTGVMPPALYDYDE